MCRASPEPFPAWQPDVRSTNGTHCGVCKCNPTTALTQRAAARARHVGSTASATACPTAVLSFWRNSSAQGRARIDQFARNTGLFSTVGKVSQGQTPSLEGHQTVAGSVRQKGSATSIVSRNCTHRVHSFRAHQPRPISMPGMVYRHTPASTCQTRRAAILHASACAVAA